MKLSIVLLSMVVLCLVAVGVPTREEKLTATGSTLTTPKAEPVPAMRVILVSQPVMSIDAAKILVSSMPAIELSIESTKILVSIVSIIPPESARILVSLISTLQPESAKIFVTTLGTLSPESAKVFIETVSTLPPESAKIFVMTLGTMSPESAKIFIATTMTLSPESTKVLVSTISTLSPETIKILVTTLSTMSPESAKVFITTTSTLSPESARVFITMISNLSPESAKVFITTTSTLSPESSKIFVAAILRLSLIKVFAADAVTSSVDESGRNSVLLWETIFNSMIDEKKQMIPSNLPAVTEFSNEKIKMIGEVRLTKDTTKLLHQMKQLQTFKDRGYNWALYSITTESIADIDQAAGIMESARLVGLKVCLAYSRSENNRTSLYTTTPNDLKEILSKLGKHADAFLPMWRGSSPAHTTSAYVGELNPFDFSMELIGRWTSEAIRESNPNLPIWGTVEFFKIATGWSPAYCSNTLVIQVANSTKGGFFPTPAIKNAVNNVTVNMRKDRPIIIGPIFYPHAYYLHQNSLNGITISQVDTQTDSIVTRVAESVGGALRLAGDGLGKNDGLMDSSW